MNAKKIAIIGAGQAGIEIAGRVGIRKKTNPSLRKPKVNSFSLSRS